MSAEESIPLHSSDEQIDRNMEEPVEEEKVIHVCVNNNFYLFYTMFRFLLSDHIQWMSL